MGIDTGLDNILAEAITELTFLPPIFESKQLDKFVDFLLEKSIKIHLKGPFGTKLDETGESGIKLLCHGCCEYISEMIPFAPEPDIDSEFDLYFTDVDRNSLKVITHLKCELEFLATLMRLTKNMKLLERLKCLEVTRITNFRIDSFIEVMAKKLKAWRCKGAGNEKRRVVLSFLLDKFGTDSMLVTKLTDLYNNGDFELKLDGMYATKSLGAHILSDSYEDDIKLSNILELKNPLDSPGLEKLAQVSKVIDQISIGTTEVDTLTNCNDKVKLSVTKLASDATYMSILTNSDFSLKNVGSLKRLLLKNRTVNYECLNSLPDTLLSLEMRFVDFEASEFPEIRLPIHLRTLKVSEFLDKDILSNIVNGDQLGELSSASIILLIKKDFTEAPQLPP
ncbi:unnamed protein product [Ambrosiozyma monospora]|uniref:Unnamed protein product n=1 Tax=Ambrosiozyma monospora TaxID=43982 RepID=A0ACB5TCZ1_AMBMO|nr:unnamed protein product [Ambrosiozyma monospora]